MKKGLIYCLICPKTNKPKYVGQTVRTLEIRLKEHKYKKDKTKTHKSNWINSLLNENLLEQLTIHKLGEYDVDFIDEMEIYWINFFEIQNIKLTNITKGSFGGYLEYTAERKKKISNKLLGIKRKPLSEERKKQIGDYWKGNKNRLGKKHTQKTKDKISNAKKGSIPHNIKKIYQFDSNGIFIKEWISATEASKHLKISQGNITSVANGKRKHASNFIWKWVN